MSEQSRIEFLVQRDGREVARAWIERTLQLYREAIGSGGFAASREFRHLFEEAIIEFEEWLRLNAGEIARRAPEVVAPHPA